MIAERNHLPAAPAVNHRGRAAGRGSERFVHAAVARFRNERLDPACDPVRAAIDVPPVTPTGDDAFEADALFADVCDRLKATASRRLARGGERTFNTTALVHALYVKVDTGRAFEFADWTAPGTLDISGL